MITNNITLVNWSNKKPQYKLNNSELNHLKIFKQHNEPEKPTSKKINNDINNEKNIKVVDKKREPTLPIYLPKKPQTNEENNGKKIIVKYIN